MKNVFSMNEMENLFEISGIMMKMIEGGEIAIVDGKSAFLYALNLAIEFEDKYANTCEYYADLYNFVADKLIEKFSV